MANQFDGKDGNGYQPLPCARADELVPPKTGCPKSARIAELENMVRKLVRQHLPVAKLEGMPGWSEVQDALKLNARVAELERECERLRKEVDKRIDQGRNSHEMLNNVLRENAELREAHDKEWRRSETNAQNVLDIAAELEACRKDAERYRWLTEDHDDREKREARRELCERLPVMSYSAASDAIDAAMQEASSDASS